MTIPDVSRERGTAMRELPLGKGDYVAGGAWSMPFLDLDGARRRRPLIFGEVMLDKTGYPELAESMFSGRCANPGDWAVMWKELGADGICLRVTEGDWPVVLSIFERTRLPLAISGPYEAVREVSEAVDDSAMILIPDDGDISAEGHYSVGRDIAVMEPTVPGPGFVRALTIGRTMRSEAILSESPGKPALCDVTGVWDLDSDGDEYMRMRRMSMLEAQSALAAMLAGADIIIVRGPGAADMARVYGEELADL